MKQLRNAAILVGLAAYAVVFYTTPLPSLSHLSETLKPWLRGQLVFVTAMRPEEWLLANWFGSPPQFSLGDRTGGLGGRVHSRLGRRARLAAAFALPRHPRADTSGNCRVLDGRRIEPAEHVGTGGGAPRATRPAADHRRTRLADVRGRRRLLVLAQTLEQQQPGGNISRNVRQCRRSPRRSGYSTTNSDPLLAAQPPRPTIAARAGTTPPP